MAVNYLEKSASHFEALWLASYQLRRGGPPSGFLQRCACSTRLIAALLLITAAAITHSFAVLAMVYVVCSLGAFFSQVDVFVYLRRNLLLTAFFAAPLAVFGALSFVTPGHAFLRIGSLGFTVQGIRGVTFVVLRALCAISATMLFMRSAGVQGLFYALTELRTPGDLVAAVQLAFSHIHVLGRTAHGMIQGMRARLITKQQLHAAYSAAANQAAVLLRKSSAASRQVHAAMLARGFDESHFAAPPRTRMRSADYLTLTVCVAIFVAGLVW